MATNNESRSSRWVLIAAVIVAVAAILWYLSAGDDTVTTSAPAGDTTVTVETPATGTATAPAATTDAPAAGGTTPAGTTTTTTSPTN